MLQTCDEAHCSSITAYVTDAKLDLMATEEHKQLSSFIKNIHQFLRIRAQRIGADEAWREHCSDKRTLQEYAVTMQRLASKFWKENSSDEKKSAQCRIEWIIGKCVDYFFGVHQTNCRAKERKQLEKLKGPLCENGEDINNVERSACLKLLDVGSCYNPFKIYPFLNVVAIDIAPATPDVYFCDFLNVKIDKMISRHSDNSISELSADLFHIVVFSLLLEYLPCPKQRHLCASNAYKVLKPEGLLFIITPDSKHASANASIMKSWRIVFAQLGMTRVYYEKLPHVHCMAFRKGIYPEVPQHWVSKQKCEVLKQENSYGLYIPQDFQEMIESSESDSSKVERTSADDRVLVDMFSELPVDFE